MRYNKIRTGFIPQVPLLGNGKNVALLQNVLYIITFFITDTDKNYTFIVTMYINDNLFKKLIYDIIIIYMYEECLKTCLKTLLSYFFFVAKFVII